MRSLIVGVVLTALCAFVAVPAAAQDDGEIKEIIVEGNKRVPTEMILTYITQEEGDQFNEELARQDFRAIWNTELFDDLKIYRRPHPSGGVTLVVEVAELPKINQIRFEGLDAISQGDIENKMTEPPNDLVIEAGSVLSYRKLAELKRIIKGLLKERGLEFSEVDYELRQVNEIETDVVFLVNEGGIVKIAEVRFVGNDSFSQWTLTRELQKSRPTWMFSWLQKDNIYSSALLEEDLIRIREFYAANGFLRVSVGEPIIETVQDDPLIGDSDMRAIITIPIKEGDQYRINEIRFEQNTLVEDEILAAIFQLKPGDMYDKKAIEESMENIGKIYKDQGYIQFITNESVEYIPEKPGYINLVVDVIENDAYFINRIDFTGNRSTRDKVLRRNIYLFEGQAFSISGFEDSMRRLNQLGYFGAVEQKIDVNHESKEVDIEFDVTETGRNQIQFGGGYSGIEGAFVNFAFTTQNFFGLGQTLSLLVQTGERNENYEVSFFDPWFMDKPVGVGVSFFSRNFEFQDFVRRGDGGRATVSFRLGRWISAFAEYRYELVEIRNPADTPFSNSIFFPEGRIATGSITPTIVRNTVDHPLLPTRGHKDTIRFEYGDTWLGGDFGFYKLMVEHISNIPLVYNNIFRIRAQVGYADVFDDQQQLPVFERFFMGGENTLRGFELRSVGPRDEFGRIIGGTSSLLLNLENNFLITREIRIVPFLDIGNAFDGEIDLDNLYYSAGLEVRFFVPVMNIPFRFIFARPLNPEDYHESSRFMFTIGSIF